MTSSVEEKAAAVNGQVKLSWREKIGYGFGDLGNGFMFDLGQAYLTKFYTDVALINPGMVATIMAVTKIYDAFMDPIAGAFVDSRKVGKHGKFRPVMMVGAIVLSILTVITFTMPDFPMWGRIVYAFVTYMAWGTCYSFTNLPYVGLANVMTRDVDERAQLATTRQAGSLGAQWITGVAFIPIILLFSDSNGKVTTFHGYAVASAIMAIIGVCCFAVTFFNCKEHIKINREKTGDKSKEGVGAYIKVVFTNKPLLAIILMTLFTISAMNTNNAMMLYFAEYNLGNMGLQPVINAIQMGCSIVAILSIPLLVKKFGKKQVAVFCFVVGAVANLINFFLPTNLTTFIVFVTLGYICLAIPNGITWAFVNDVIDYGEWHTGIRKEGITVAAFNFSRKLAQSLAAIISAGILGLTGYVANQAQSQATLNGIKGAMTLYPAVALFAAMLIIFFLYGLTDDKYRKIADDLNNGKWEKGELTH
ncbi:glycoside-pentoside-hexuronide (GPH):cation symporter [Bifidobacterium sp. 82T24]|uniref:glycoside-pentoside-hexuronide (GPH):cation symporter n=1 Tax=Bifidobacterium pluvialisilvae TaxID=2834436 RepID=UPI001C5796FE|nr:glycoside-pentoside-hexuronide (GPH):cation symporter [Bifidobacterium pluvialisilvae]MBW3088787.1 glycoside-pentoside-hexuronide (GPH):cation symporter [Bifidobacterium pluvialisilvae]